MEIKEDRKEKRNCTEERERERERERVESKGRKGSCRKKKGRKDLWRKKGFFQIVNLNENKRIKSHCFSELFYSDTSKTQVEFHYFRSDICFIGTARGVTVIVVGTGLSYPSSNPGRGC